MKFLWFSAEDFNVGGELNNVSIHDLLSRYIILDSGDKPQHLYVNLIAEDNVIFNEDITAGMINGVNPSAYFASVRASIFYTGLKLVNFCAQHELISPDCIAARKS